MRILPRPTWVLSVIAFLVFATILVVDGTVRGGVGVPDSTMTAKGKVQQVPFVVTHGQQVVEARTNPVQTFALRKNTVALTFDGGPEPRDVHVDRAVDRGVIGRMPRAGEFRQRLARKDAPCPLGHRQQQVELIGGQDLLVIRHAHRASGAVDFQPAKPQHVGACLAGVSPAQHNPDAGQELTRLERLGDVVFSADFETDHPVHWIAARREHDYRNSSRRRLGGKCTKQIEPVGVREHEIEQQEIEAAGPQTLKAGAARLGKRHLEMLPTQIIRNHCGQAGVVVDEKNAGHGGRMI